MELQYENDDTSPTALSIDSLFAEMLNNDEIKTIKNIYIPSKHKPIGLLPERPQAAGSDPMDQEIPTEAAILDTNDTLQPEMEPIVDTYDARQTETEPAGVVEKIGFTSIPEVLFKIIQPEAAAGGLIAEVFFNFTKGLKDNAIQGLHADAENGADSGEIDAQLSIFDEAP